MPVILEFEKSLAELDNKLNELRHLSSSEEANIVNEIKRFEEKGTKLLKKIYQNLTPWQKVLVARHP